MRAHIIGIAGPSSSGKTELAKQLARKLPGTSIVSLDFYYRGMEEIPLEERKKVNFDHPDSLDWELLHHHLQAIAAGRAFNLIHISLGNKVDIFPATEDFHLCQLERATRVALAFLDDPAEYPIATAEDILLAKLRWYRAGGEVSERQWADIMGILATSPAFDRAYTRSWAARLGVEDLLARALAEAER